VAKATSPALLVLLVAGVSALLWLRRFRFEAVVLASTVVFAYGVGGLAKLAEHRARPASPINLSPESEASFPSGHVLIVATIAIVALSLAWSHLSTTQRALAASAGAALTLAVAVDRLIVGAHWLTDVVGSLALAAVFGAMVIAVIELRSRLTEQ
jgi:undecaprenyl-diphosphatase